MLKQFYFQKGLSVLSLMIFCFFLAKHDLIKRLSKSSSVDFLFLFGVLKNPSCLETDSGLWTSRGKKQVFFGHYVVSFYDRWSKFQGLEIRHSGHLDEQIKRLSDPSFSWMLGTSVQRFFDVRLRSVRGSIMKGSKPCKQKIGTWKRLGQQLGIGSNQLESWRGFLLIMEPTTRFSGGSEVFIDIDITSWYNQVVAGPFGFISLLHSGALDHQQTGYSVSWGVTRSTACW